MRRREDQLWSWLVENPGYNVTIGWQAHTREWYAALIDHADVALLEVLNPTREEAIEQLLTYVNENRGL